MNPLTSLSTRFRTIAPLVAGLMFLAAPDAKAQTYYWDNNGTAAGFGTATGTWDTAGSSLWNTLADGTDPIINTSTTTSTVINFGTAAAGLGAGTITVGTVSAGDITFGSASGAIVLSGGTITLAATSTITVNNATNTISSILAGAGTSLTKAGTGTLILGANDPTFTGGVTINQGTVSTGAFTNPFGNNPITLDSGAVWTRAGTAYSREISGAGTFKSTVTSSINLQCLLDATYSGGATDEGRWIINKYGPAKWTATGSHTGTRDAGAVHGGEFVIAGNTALGASSAGVYTLSTSGTLTLDNVGTNLASRYRDTDALTFSGGTLKYLGNSSAASTETVGAMTLTATYASTVDIQTGSGQNATVTFASLSRGAGSAVNYKYTNNGGGTAGLVFTTAPVLTNGIVNGMFVNGADFAMHGGTAGPETIAALGSYTNPTDINTLIAANNALINSSTTTQTLSAPRSANALKIDGAQAIDLNGNKLSLGGPTLAAMILKTSSGSATISGSPANSLLENTGATNMDYVVRVHAGDLTLSAPVNMNGTASFAKSGTGLLVLTPSAAWTNTANTTDILRVQEGAIRLDPTAANFGNIQRQLAGGVLELTADWSPTIGTGNANVNWAAAADGGFAASGTTRTVTLGSTLTWGTTSHVQNGKALLFNSDTANAKIVMANNIDLAGASGQLWFREFRVAGNTNPNAYAEITGNIIGTSNQSHLLKTGTGRLDLSGTNTYQGETIVHGGTLNINGTLAALTAPSHGTVTVMTGATLGGNGRVGGAVTVTGGTIPGTITAGTGTGVKTLNLDSTLHLGTGARYATTIFSTGSGDASLLNVAGSVTFSSGSFVTLNLSNVTPLALSTEYPGPTGTSYTILSAPAGITNGGLTIDYTNSTMNGFSVSDFSLMVTSNTVVLNYSPVPEPGMILGIAVAGMGLAGWVRRRRMGRANVQA